MLLFPHVLFVQVTIIKVTKNGMRNKELYIIYRTNILERATYFTIVNSVAVPIFLLFKSFFGLEQGVTRNKQLEWFEFPVPQKV